MQITRGAAPVTITGVIRGLDPRIHPLERWIAGSRRKAPARQ